VAFVAVAQEITSPDPATPDNSAGGNATAELPTLGGSAIDVEALRAQTLGDLLPQDLNEPLLQDRFAIEHLTDNARSWGIVSGRIPDVLRLHCREISDGRGVLVAGVDRQSPAECTGLQSGQILLKVDDRVLYGAGDLPPARNGAEVTLLDHGELRRASLVGAGRGAARARPEHPGGVASNSVDARGWSTASARTAGNMGQAVSIACANGRYSIAVSVPDAAGGRTVRLEGTRDQVEQQLTRLPPSVQNAVRRQLGGGF